MPRRVPVCREYKRQQGACPYGVGCRFLHPTVLCKYYHGPKRRCWNGDACRYAHEARVLVHGCKLGQGCRNHKKPLNKVKLPCADVHADTLECIELHLFQHALLPERTTVRGVNAERLALVYFAMTSDMEHSMGRDDFHKALRPKYSGRITGRQIKWACRWLEEPSNWNTKEDYDNYGVESTRRYEKEIVYWTDLNIDSEDPLFCARCRQFRCEACARLGECAWCTTTARLVGQVIQGSECADLVCEYMA